MHLVQHKFVTVFAFSMFELSLQFVKVDIHVGTSLGSLFLLKRVIPCLLRILNTTLARRPVVVHTMVGVCFLSAGRALRTGVPTSRLTASGLSSIHSGVQKTIILR